MHFHRSKQHRTSANQIKLLQSKVLEQKWLWFADNKQMMTVLTKIVQQTQQIAQQTQDIAQQTQQIAQQTQQSAQQIAQQSAQQRAQQSAQQRAQQCTAVHSSAQQCTAVQQCTADPA